MLTFPEYRLQSQLAVKFRSIVELFANTLAHAWCNQIERDSLIPSLFVCLASVETELRVALTVFYFARTNSFEINKSNRVSHDHF